MMEKPLSDGELYQSRFGEKESKATTIFWSVLLAIFLLIFCFRLYISNHFIGVEVSGPSMNKTLYNGEELLMRKIDEEYKAKRGDVIVVNVKHYKFPPKDGESTEFLIKRLIAIEGDRVRCTDGVLEICYVGTDEFVTLDEPYAYYSNAKDYDFVEEYIVGEGEVFFLGDNRNNSQDSRYKEGKSYLKCLYKATDIYGVVPKWAIDNQKVLKWFFFPENPFNKD